MKDKPSPQPGARIRAIREAKQLTLQQVADAVAKITGKPTDPINISRLERGKQGYTGTTLEAIARALGVDIIALFGKEEVDEAPALRPFRSLPVVGEVMGGIDGYLEEFQHPAGHGDGTVAFPAKHKSAYALRVRGDSQRPRIRPGEYIIVEPDMEARPGDEVVVKLTDGRKLLKQLLYIRDGDVSLGSVNDAYAPITVALSEVESIHPVTGILPRGAFIPA